MSVIFLTDSPAWCAPLCKELQSGFNVPSLVVDVAPILAAAYEPTAPLRSIVPEGTKVVVNRLSARPGGETAALVTAFRTVMSALGITSNGSQQASSPEGANPNQLVFVNDANCHSIGASKVLQAALFVAVGAKTPRTVMVSRAGLHATHQRLRRENAESKWLLKPNVGGKGAGILPAETLAAGATLDSAAETTLSDAFGPDGTAVLQEVIATPDKMVHRVELVNFKSLYTAHVPVDDGGSYNNCVSDVCARPKKKAAIVVEAPSNGNGEVLAMCETIARACGMQLGSIEYLVDSAGQAWFIDINPVSTVLKEAQAVIGESPLVAQARWLSTLVQPKNEE